MLVNLYTMLPVCPKCDIAMVLLEFAEVELDYCPQCSGVWVDAGELQEILTRTGAQVEGDPTAAFVPVNPDKRRARMCPRCDRDLQETMPPLEQVMELRIDRCPAGDGIWFDKGELPQLLDAMPPETNAGAAAALLREVLGTGLSDDVPSDKEITQ